MMRNNFNFIRMIAATMVIVSHSYPLSKEDEILEKITQGQVGLGSLAVKVFFVISGFLILKSLQNSISPLNYVWKRTLRLFPGLFIMLLITLFILPIVYTGNQILLEKSFWSYLPNNMSLYRVQYHVNHVFNNNPYPNAINGSLWSLAYEFTMYMGLLVLYPIRKSHRLLYILPLLFIVIYLTSLFKITLFKNYWSILNLDTHQLYPLATYFLGGSIIALHEKILFHKKLLCIFSICILVVSLYFNIYNITAPILLPIGIMSFGLLYSKKLNWFTDTYGDISYGVYIYGFLIQQLVMNFFDINSILLTGITLPIVFVISYISWHYIEKKALINKNYIR